MSENIKIFDDEISEDEISEDIHILKMYAEVKTWDDLCKTNLNLFNQKIYRTFYYTGKLDYETLDTAGFLEDLIELNKKGIFTYSSQPGFYTPYVKQKSYINFSCEYEVGMKLVMKLLADNDIYFMLQYTSDINPIYFDNFPEKRYNLSDIYGQYNGEKEYKWGKGTNWNRWAHIENLTIKEPYISSCSRRFIGEDSLVNTMLSNSIHIIIAHKEYDENFSAPKKLLELLTDV